VEAKKKKEKRYIRGEHPAKKKALFQVFIRRTRLMGKKERRKKEKSLSQEEMQGRRAAKRGMDCIEPYFNLKGVPCKWKGALRRRITGNHRENTNNTSHSSSNYTVREKGPRGVRTNGR